jgi:hypothetical protein
MAELPMRDRGATARLTRLKLLADLECAESNAEFRRRRYIKHLDEQFAKIMGATTQ